MILKEAFRMQNHLDSLLGDAERLLLSPLNLMQTVEKHNKHKANPNDEDETIEVKRDTEYAVDDVLNFVTNVFDEKQKLSDAIAQAKAAAEINIDSSLAMNKERQKAIVILEAMAKMKATEAKTQGCGYLIDNDGKQQPYTYEVEQVRTIAFDRNKVRGMLKAYQKKSDEISTKVDQINVTADVDYAPVYDFSDSFEEAMDQFLGK